jgi:hypothetical protein
MDVKIEKQELGEDPLITTYLVTLSSSSGIWVERWTLGELKVFLRGVEAGVAMSGQHFLRPEIPM